MRRILVDGARRALRKKHGAGVPETPIDEVPLAAPAPDLERDRVSRDFRRSAARRIEGVLTNMARLRRKWIAANPSEATRRALETSHADFDRAVARGRALQK